MSGKFWKYFHLIGIILFLVLWGIAWIAGWIESVRFVSHVSMAALVLAELSAWQAARVERKEDERNGK